MSNGKTRKNGGLFGDDLDPAEISQLLQASPTSSARKGDTRSFKSGQTKIFESGSWLLEVSDRAPGNLDGQITELFASLTSDIHTWTSLAERFQIDIYCGLFMEGPNEGAHLTATTLAAMGQRGVALNLDVYDPVKEDAPPEPR